MPAPQGSAQGGPPSAQIPPGPPYLPRFAGLGGSPTIGVDVPISSVILVLFILSAILNMTISITNKRRGHKFILSNILFGFSMARITANVMRIVWAAYPHNIRIGIAAQIFTYLGVVLLFLINLILSQRVLRAYHPHIGWSLPARLIFRFLYFTLASCIILIIIAVVWSFYTLNETTLANLHDVQLTSGTTFAILAFLPLPITLFCLIFPRRGPIDKFGAGRMRHKLLLLIFTSLLLSLGASFRAGIAFIQRPAADPAWFHSKACFYCFNYLIELIVVYMYALSRFDRRFHIPNGSSAPGHYSQGVRAETEMDNISAESNTDVEARSDTERTERGSQHQSEKDKHESA